MIYPEGGRSPDGWGQEFKGGAAYLSARTGAPVVPVFIDGTGSIFGKGMKRPKPGGHAVVFGAPLRPDEGESTRRFNARIEAAVTTLGRRGDDRLLDGPPPRRRRHEPDARRPRVHRLAPAVGAHRRAAARASPAWRRRPKRRWPDLG